LSFSFPLIYVYFYQTGRILQGKNLMALAPLTINKTGEIPVFIELPTDPVLPFATDFDGVGNSGLVCNLGARFIGLDGSGISGAIFSQTGYAYLQWEATSGTFHSAGFYNSTLIGYKSPFSSSANTDWEIMQVGVSVIGGVQAIGPLSTVTITAPFTTNIGPIGDFKLAELRLETKSDAPQVGIFAVEDATNDCYFWSFNSGGTAEYFNAFTLEIGEDNNAFFNANQIYAGSEYRLFYLSPIGELVFIDYNDGVAADKWLIDFDDLTLNALIGDPEMQIRNATQFGFVLRVDTGTGWRWVLVDPQHNGYQEIIVTYADAQAQEFAYPTLGADTGLEIAFDDAGNLYAFGYDFDNDVTYGMNAAFPNYSDIPPPVVPRPVPVRLPCIDGGMPCIPLIKEEK